jgi:hypothetical protein
MPPREILDLKGFFQGLFQILIWPVIADCDGNRNPVLSAKEATNDKIS